MSEQRACRVIGADISSIRFEALRPDDAELRDRLHELARERRRFGYRRARASEAGGLPGEPQACPAHLRRGEAPGTAPRRPQASARNAGADGAARSAERPMVARLRSRRRASSAGCATNSSTRRCSARSTTPVWCWKPGGSTTTARGLTRASAGSHHTNMPTASAAALPGARKGRQITTGFRLRLDEERGSRQVVSLVHRGP